MATATKKKVPRNYFHVLPLMSDPSESPTGKPMVIGWVVRADEKTGIRLMGTTEAHLKAFIVATSNSPLFTDKKAAITYGRAVAREAKPSELMIHRLPKKGERKGVYPICDRSSYGNDPKSTKG